jgi:hypothetical protein
MLSFRNRFSNKKVIITGTVIILLPVLFLLRGWIRTSVVPTYVEATYGKQLSKIVDQQIMPLHNELASLGLTFKEYENYVPGKKCGLAYFSIIQETVVCSTGYHAEIAGPSQEQKNALAMRGNAFEQRLKDSGWSAEHGYYAKSINLFFDTGYAAVSYKKQVGSTLCDLNFSWQPEATYASELPSLSIDTSCRRDVKFFGGSDKL